MLRDSTEESPGFSRGEDINSEKVEELRDDAVWAEGVERQEAGRVQLDDVAASMADGS